MGQIKIVIIYILYIFIISCASDRKLPIANAGQDECAIFKKMATYCLRDWLVGEDAGGTWYQIGTTPEDISGELIGDNPCIDWTNKACGPYPLMYVVGDACCRDTAYVNPLKCCPMTGNIICN